MKRRVLFFANNLKGGGAEKIMNIILKNLDRQKYDIHVYSLHEPDNKEEWPSDINYKYLYRHAYSNSFHKLRNLICNKIKLIIYDRVSPKIFYRLFVNGKYDVEIAFIEGYSTRIVSGSTNSNSKKKAWIHCNLFEDHWTKIAFRNNSEEIDCYKRFDNVYCVSESVATSFRQLYPELNKVEVIYNPIDELEILAKSKLSEVEIMDEKQFVFVSVGRLVNQKGYDRIIPIVAELKNKGYLLKLYIIGEGEDCKKLETMIDEYEVSDSVKLLGYKKNPYPYIRCANAFVCSSRNEGYSTAVTESIILGTPVVTVNCAGMTELLGENSEYGIVTDNNKESLQSGMIKIMDPVVNAHYREMATRRAGDFTLKKLLKDFEKCLY